MVIQLIHKRRAFLVTLLVLMLCLPTLVSAQNNPPAPVTLKYVTVDYTEDYVHIFWNQTTSIDVDGYIIWGKDDITDTDYLVIDTVDATEDSFIDSFAHPHLKPEAYNVTPYNSNGLSDFADQEHHTVYLQSSFRRCYGEVNLQWSHYVGWQEVYRYRIWANNGGLDFEVITVDGDENSFKHTTIFPDIYYDYWIEAISASSNYTSFSNLVVVDTEMPNPPIFFNADYASVIAEDEIELSFTVEENEDIEAFEVRRSMYPDMDDYEIRRTFDSSEVFFNNVIYIDNTNTDRVWYYTLAAINSCHVPFTKTSNVASNILLTGDAHQNMENQINWTNYFDWKGDVDYYSIYHIVDNDTFLLANTAYGDTSFIDDIEAFIENFENSEFYDPDDETQIFPLETDYRRQPVISGSFCYYIVAHAKNNPEDGFNSEATSNTFCKVYEPVVWVPNAIAPASNIVKNRIFQPYVSFGALSDYNLQIYNRWGIKIWETNILKQGWDGTTNGNPAPFGVYLYIVRYSDGNGNSKEMRGNVTVIR